MGKITVDEFKKLYPTKEVPPYGECIVVPGDKFDPDWEVDLGDQDHACFNVLLDRKPVTLVQLEKSVGAVTLKGSLEADSKTELPGVNSAEFPWSDEDEKKLLRRMNELEGTVYERAELLVPEFHGRSAVALRQKFYKLTGLRGSSRSKSRPKPKFLYVPWSVKEDDLLIELWNKRVNNKRLKRSAIAEKLPGRSHESIQNRLKALQKLGRIEPRWKQKPRKPRSETAKPSEHGIDSQLAYKQPGNAIPTPADLQRAIEKITVDINGILSILEGQNHVIDKLLCMQQMQGLEIKASKGKFTIPFSLWEHYANAILEDDKKFRDVFREKVRKLLEACA